MDDEYKTKPLCIMLPKTSAYKNNYDDESKLIYFLIEYDKLLKQYNDIWNQVSNSTKNELNCKFLKTKIKSYGGEYRDFYNKGIPKVGSNYTCLAVILMHFVVKKDENYYPQIFLKECKYTENK